MKNINLRFVLLIITVSENLLDTCSLSVIIKKSMPSFSAATTKSFDL
mgnify:CR=1 FL=1